VNEYDMHRNFYSRTTLPNGSGKRLHQKEIQPWTLVIKKTNMPTIILKKTFKVKPSGFSFANEKSFSFHGGIPDNVVQEINRILHSCIHVSNGANKPQFKMDEHGHYSASMNHKSQKYHEEDFVVAIIDVFERFGWTFRFQYDSSMESHKVVGGDSYTSREMFIFQKSPLPVIAQPI
jgi:hypothetical protein